MRIDPMQYPLPRPTGRPARRRSRIGGLSLGRHALRQFQRVADRLDPQTAVPDADLVVSTGRALLLQYRGFRRAPPVSIRRRWLCALRTMADDPGWRLDVDSKEPLAMLRSYDAGTDRLIPDAVPVVGGLDDALLVDRAWPRLHRELEAYLAFRQARTEVAMAQGQHACDVHFDRWQWLARLEEQQAWRRHQRTHGLDHYGVTSGPMFHIF